MVLLPSMSCLHGCLDCHQHVAVGNCQHCSHSDEERISLIAAIRANTMLCGHARDTAILMPTGITVKLGFCILASMAVMTLQPPAAIQASER